MIIKTNAFEKQFFNRTAISELLHNVTIDEYGDVSVEITLMITHDTQGGGGGGVVYNGQNMYI